MKNVPWDEIKDKYEEGVSLHVLAKQYSISRPTINRHATAGGWVRGIGQYLENRGLTVEQGEQIKEALIEQHKAQWIKPIEILAEALEKRNFELAKLAKISSEAYAIIQQSQRRTWGIPDRQIIETHSEVVLTKEQRDAATKAALLEAEYGGAEQS